VIGSVMPHLPGRAVDDGDGAGAPQAPVDRQDRAQRGDVALKRRAHWRRDQILRRVVDLIKANAPGGELGPTLEMIETALIANQPKMIEAE